MKDGTTASLVAAGTGSVNGLKEPQHEQQEDSPHDESVDVAAVLHEAKVEAPAYRDTVSITLPLPVCSFRIKADLLYVSLCSVATFSTRRLYLNRRQETHHSMKFSRRRTARSYLRLSSYRCVFSSRASSTSLPAAEP